MIQSFKQWCVEEWAKQSPLEKLMIINAAPAMFFIVGIMVMIAVGAPFPLLTLGPIAGIVQAVWSTGYIGFSLWRKWRDARTDYDKGSEWREDSNLSRLISNPP